VAKLSFAAYAKHRGVSPAAVTRAVQSGRIQAEKDPATGRRVIDSDAADAAWASNSDESKAIGARAAGAGAAGAAGAAGTPPGDSEATASASYTLSRAKRERFNAEFARLKYEQALGSLVLAADVRKQAFAAARVIREALLNLPDRLAAPLAGETDPRRVHQMLKTELTQILQELADDPLRTSSI
jgi:hypothetical protein